MTTASPQKSRPLSPHLGIYKPQISSVMSILHRATGVSLAFALLFFVALLVMLAGGEGPYGLFIGNLHVFLGHCALVVVLFIVLFCALNAIVAAAFRPSGFARGFSRFIVIVASAAIAGTLWYFIQARVADTYYMVFWYVGEAILLGWTWAFFYHFCCGIRHMLWDAGWFLSLKGMHVTGWITLVISTGVTLLAWLKILGYIK